MPRYRKETEEAKARLLAKSYIANGMNKSRVAEIEGVRPQAIVQRFQHNKAIPRTLQEELRKIGITPRYKSDKFKQLLETKERKYNKKGKLIKVDDSFIQLGALRLVCQVDGDIKESKNGGVQITSIIINLKSPDKLINPLEQERINANH